MDIPGSTNREGYLYHEPAFPVKGKKYHRGDNAGRLDMLLKLHDWQHERVIDLGCNVGYFTIKLAMQGARTTGIDLDRDALEIGRSQAREYGIEDCNFFVPDLRYFKDKTVVLALSVLPWIYKTQSNAETFIKKMFEIPLAFVEIPYPPDGRAHVPGVVDDATAISYLQQYYPFVTLKGYCYDHTDGVVRKRALFRCSFNREDVPKEAGSHYGSQSTIVFDHEVVIKKRRDGKQWDAKREGLFLAAMEKYHCSPIIVRSDPTEIVMEHLNGVPLTTCPIDPDNLEAQFQYIAAALKSEDISHNDIRPGNMTVVDGRVHLLDYGWATWGDDTKPDNVNPIYKGRSDQDSLDIILWQYKRWYENR